MANYYQQPGGGGRGSYGGMRDPRMGPGPGGRGHPHQMGMMGNQMQGGMMDNPRDPRDPRGGDPRDSMMRGDPGVGRGGGSTYERGGFEMNSGIPGPPLHRGVPHPTMMSPTGGRPNMDPGFSAPPIVNNKPLPGNPGVRYANDCEIIVTAKAQQQYGEFIEKAIKEFQLKVDLMFPKPDVKLASFIDNIASMGTIFAVVIRPDNEAHRSVSVHVLRGPPKPEEHRNMPLTAAYQLIKDRYSDLKRKEVGIIPDNVKVIFKYLMEDKPLNEVEYSTVIKFLQERRRKQNAFEKRTNNIIDDGSVQDLLCTPEAEELKAKILSIMSGESPLPKNRTVTGERIGELLVPRPTEPLGALNPEPTVQSALETLMTPGVYEALNTNISQNQGSQNQEPRGYRGTGFGRGQPQQRYGY